MTRPTKNDRTVTLTEPALKVYDSWPHMEKSKKVSEAIIKHGKHSRDTGTDLQAQINDHELRLRELEGKK